MRPILSFVIPVKNDAERLARCLRSIRASSRPAGPVEIIVVDNGSTDHSVSTARTFGATVLSLPGSRLGALRNEGAAIAGSSVLAFVDADNEIGPGWVAAAIDAMSVPGVVGVGAPYHSPAGGTWVQQTYDSLRRHPRGQQPVDWLGSGNLLVRRAAFTAVGGFDPTLETCEDVDLCRKLRAAGHLLLSDDRLVNVHHGDPATLWHVFAGELWRGRDNLRVSFRQPRTWRIVTSAIIPALMLLALVVGVTGFVWGSTRGLQLGVAAMMLMLALPSVRAFSMVRQPSRIGDLPSAFVVACAYELGRALALAARAGYGSRRGVTT